MLLKSRKGALKNRESTGTKEEKRGEEKERIRWRDEKNETEVRKNHCVSFLLQKIWEINYNKHLPTHCQAGRAEQQQISGHHDRRWHKVYWNKGLKPLPTAFIQQQAHLYSITPPVQYAHVPSVLTTITELYQLLILRGSFCQNVNPSLALLSDASYTEKKKKKKTLHNTQLQFVLWQALLPLMLPRTWSVRHLMHLKEILYVWAESVSQPISRLPVASSLPWTQLWIQDRMYRKEV